MSDITVVEPDLVYLDAARLSLLSERGLEGAPTLAVEIVSRRRGVSPRRDVAGDDSRAPAAVSRSAARSRCDLALIVP
jgi:hypothetical protein